MGPGYFQQQLLQEIAPSLAANWQKEDSTLFKYKDTYFPEAVQGSRIKNRKKGKYMTEIRKSSVKEKEVISYVTRTADAIRHSKPSAFPSCKFSLGQATCCSSHLAGHTLHHQVGFKSWFLTQLPANAHRGKQKMMAQILEALPLT